MQHNFSSNPYPGLTVFDCTSKSFYKAYQKSLLLFLNLEDLVLKSVLILVFRGKVLVSRVEVLTTRPTCTAYCSVEILFGKQENPLVSKTQAYIVISGCVQV